MSGEQMQQGTNRSCGKSQQFDFLKERDQTLDEVRHAYDLAMSGDDISAVEFGISAGERLGEILRQAQR